MLWTLKALSWSNEPTGWDSKLVSLQCGLVCFVYFKDQFCSHNNSDCRWSWFVSFRLKLGSELYTNCSPLEFTYNLSLALSVTFSCINISRLSRKFPILCVRTLFHYLHLLDSSISSINCNITCNESNWLTEPAVVLYLNVLTTISLLDLPVNYFNSENCNTKSSIKSNDCPIPFLKGFNFFDQSKVRNVLND